MPKDKASEGTQGKVPVAKALNEDKRQALFVVLEPQPEGDYVNDLHGDYYDAETVEKACRSFNENCMKANLFHMQETESFSFIESYISASDMMIGERLVKSGTWLARIQVSKSADCDWIWDGIKSGEFCGLSIQAMGSTQELN